MPSTKFVVCGGGGLKVFWLAGRLRRLAQEEVIDESWRFVGTSAGALALGFLSHRLYLGDPLLYATELLVKFLQTVTRAEDVVKPRSAFAMASDVLRGRWGGLVSLDPLRGLLERALGPGRAGDYAAVANVYTRDVQAMPMSAWSVLASSSEPVLTPTVQAGWADGGLREIAPISLAIDLGAERILGLVTQSENLPYRAIQDRAPSLAETLDGTLGAMTEEILANDIALTQAYNALVLAGRPAKPHHRLIGLTIQRPLNPLPGHYTNFTVDQAREMLERGLYGD